MPISDNLPTRIAEWAGVGTTYYVDAAIGSDSNSETQAQSEATPWASIQKAVDSYVKPATGHVRILVKNGTYRKAGGTNAVNATVNFFNQGARAGDATHVIHILAYPGHTPIIEEATYTGASPTTSERHAFWFDDVNAKFIRIRGFELKPNGSSVALNQCQAFRIDGTTADIEIDDCYIHGWKASGGGVNPRSQGIFVETGATRCHFYNLIIHNIGDSATEAANLSHGLYIGGSNHVLVNILSYDNRNGFGIQFYEGGGGGTGHIVSHTVTANNKKSGIVVDGTFVVDIRNSIFYDNDEWGVSSRTSATVTVENSISNANGFVGNQGDGYNTEGTSTITRANNITSDPSFIDYASRNFRYNLNSPAYDNGVIEYSSASDIEGTARVTSTIGVYVAPEETIIVVPPAPPPVSAPSRPSNIRREWRVVHLDHDFVELGEVFPSNLNFSLPLSAVGDCNYEIILGEPLATWQKTFPYVTDYLLALGDKILQGGIHTGIAINDVEQATVQVSGNDYLHYLERRWYPFDPLNLAGAGYIAPIGTDLFALIEALLDATLALPDSLEMFYDNGLSGQTINDFKIEAGDTEDIKSKIETLSKKAPGFDYWADPFRELHLYPDGRGTIKEFTFEQGKNIYLLDYANRGPSGTHTLGIVQGEGNKIARTRDHTGIATYRRLDVHEDLAIKTTDVAAVQEATDAESERNIAPSIEFSARFVGEEDIDILNILETGDRPMVHADLGWAVVSDYMRIVNIQGQTDDEGNFELIFTFDDGTLAQ